MIARRRFFPDHDFFRFVDFLFATKSAPNSGRQAAAQGRSFSGGLGLVPARRQRPQPAIGRSPSPVVFLFSFLSFLFCFRFFRGYFSFEGEQARRPPLRYGKVDPDCLSRTGIGHHM